MPEQKDNSGALFKNTKKERENQPDYSGPGMIGGQEGRLACWLNKDRNGNTYMAWKWSPQDEQQQGAPQGQSGNPVEPDDVPFAPDMPEAF